MIRLKFKCKLLTDVILNQKSASEGANQTLDFIPGSNFLGIVASKIYEVGAMSLDIFHSGKVRFGDAHPANGLNRTLRIPAAFYFPKGESEKERTYFVHHEIENPSSEKLRKIQLKQERNGYADFCGITEKGGTAVRLKVKTDFSIKSAYDRNSRRSLDSQLFAYQSMGKGMDYFFTVEIDDKLSVYSDTIMKELEGTHRVGRSRSAQYGLVKISSCNDFNEVNSGSARQDNLLVIYAESRLIFLDENGQPTFQPTFQQLLGRMEVDRERKDSERTEKILWDKSQLRTFQYAPYNYQRRCFDTDRCGIEKGSVIVVQLSKAIDISKLATHLGCYLNEGFGKVIYNPSFLSVTPSSNGELSYKIIPSEEGKLQAVDNPGTVLTNYLCRKKTEKEESASIYSAVNDWIKDPKILKIFATESFASQWGQIRNIALRVENSSELVEALFMEDTGYLVHGVAKDKWGGKTKLLKEFVENHSPKAVVNLASEMQKRCK